MNISNPLPSGISPIREIRMRNLIVQDSTMPTRGPRGAEVRMRGQWLRAAGFHPGARVAVHLPSPGVIELRICDAAQFTDADFTAAMAGFQKIGL